MKKNKLTVLLLTVMLCSPRLYAQNETTCKMKIILQHAGNRMIYLSKDVYVPNASKAILDSATFKGDSLFFNFKNIRPGFYSLFLKNDQKFLPIFLDASNITITGNADLIYQSHIIGSRQMDIWFTFNRVIKTDKQHEEHLFKQLVNADGNKKIDSVHFYKQKLDSVQTVLYRKVDSLFAAYPQSFATIKYLDVYDKLVLTDAKEIELLERMPDPYKKTDDYLNLRNKIKSRAIFAVGSKFKDFELPDMNNRMTSTKNHNRYLLVDFWASWCVPCRRANPVLKKIYTTYRSKGLTMISVSIDKNTAAWKEAIKDDGLNWEQLIAINGTKEPEIFPFAISEVPTTYLVDGRGIIIAKNLPIQELEKKVQSIFNE